MRWIAIVSTLLTLVLVGAGCQGQEVIELAPIHEVRVNILESFPPQVSVYIKGGLRDSCARFHGIAVTRPDEKTIEIRVTTRHIRNAQCLQVYGYFEQNVNLGSDFTPGETYTVRVNGQTTTFVMTQ